MSLEIQRCNTVLAIQATLNGLIAELSLVLSQDPNPHDPGGSWSRSDLLWLLEIYNRIQHVQLTIMGAIQYEGIE